MARIGVKIQLVRRRDPEGRPIFPMRLNADAIGKTDFLAIYDSAAKVSVWCGGKDALHKYYPSAIKTSNYTFITGFSVKKFTPAKVWIIPQVKICDGKYRHALVINNLMVAAPDKDEIPEFAFALLLSANLFLKHRVIIDNEASTPNIVIEGEETIAYNPVTSVALGKRIVTMDNVLAQGDSRTVKYHFKCLGGQKNKKGEYIFKIESNKTKEVTIMERRRVLNLMRRGARIEGLKVDKGDRIHYIV